jgi:hypothetical protein
MKVNFSLSPATYMSPATYNILAPYPSVAGVLFGKSACLGETGRLCGDDGVTGLPGA